MRMARADELAMPIEPVAPVQELTRSRSTRGGPNPPNEDRAESAAGHADPAVTARAGSRWIWARSTACGRATSWGRLRARPIFPGARSAGIEILKDRTIVEVSTPYVEQVLGRMGASRMRGHWATLYRLD